MLAWTFASATAGNAHARMEAEEDPCLENAHARVEGGVGFGRRSLIAMPMLASIRTPRKGRARTANLTPANIVGARSGHKRRSRSLENPKDRTF